MFGMFRFNELFGWYKLNRILWGLNFWKGMVWIYIHRCEDDGTDADDDNDGEIVFEIGHFRLLRCGKRNHAFWRSTVCNVISRAKNMPRHSIRFRDKFIVCWMILLRLIFLNIMFIYKMRKLQRESQREMTRGVAFWNGFYCARFQLP